MYRCSLTARTRGGPVCTPHSQPTAPPRVPSLDLTPAAITSSLSGVGEGGERDRWFRRKPAGPMLPSPQHVLSAPHLGPPRSQGQTVGPGPRPCANQDHKEPSLLWTLSSLLFSAPKSSVLSLARASLTAYGGSGENVAPKGPSAPVQL